MSELASEIYGRITYTWNNLSGTLQVINKIITLSFWEQFHKNVPVCAIFSHTFYSVIRKERHWVKRNFGRNSVQITTSLVERSNPPAGGF